MISFFILIGTIWVGLPVLDKLVTEWTSPKLVEVSKLPGFWDFVTGRGVSRQPENSDFMHVHHPWGTEVRKNPY